MVNFFNRLVLSLIPFIPRTLIRQIAGRYVAGETKDEALATVKLLNDRGFSTTIDILGEYVKSPEKARKVTERYIELFNDIHKQKLDCNISLKLSHIGAELSDSLFNQNIDLLLSKARDTHNFLRIDMESSKFTDRTIRIYRSCIEKYPGVGTVFQAYLYRTEKDLQSLFSSRFNFRLCKGIYREDPAIAIQDRRKISNNFLKLLKAAFENECYVGIATHDLDLLKNIYRMIDEMHIPADKFEFQVLYGVPMSGWLEKHLVNGFKVRIYIPFGPEWYDYSIRRLKENPNIVGYVMSNLFQRK